MPAVLRRIFPFVMPVMVISYYPAAAVCGWGVHYYQESLALPAGTAFLMLARFVWGFGMKHYQSTGS